MKRCEHCNTKENLSKCQTKRMYRKKLVLIREWYECEHCRVKILNERWGVE